MAGYTPKLVDIGFQHWIKANLALNITKDGIKDAVRNKTDTFHRDALTDILTPEQIKNNDFCTQCTIQNVLHCRTKGICILKAGVCTFHQSTPYQPCPKRICDRLRDKIRKCHKFNMPSWKNTRPERWFENPWELAKCYFPPDGYIAVTTVDETDLNGILSLLLNHDAFKSIIDEKSCEETREIGRVVRHSPNLCIDEKDMSSNLDTLVKFLSCSNLFQADSKATESVQKLKQLKAGSLTIASEDVTKVLHDVIQENTRGSVEEINKTAAQRANEIIADLHKLQNVRSTSLKDILTAKTTAISDIDKNKDAGISEINKNKDRAIFKIDKSKHAGISEIDKNKESAISEIDKSKHAGISDIDKHKESAISEIDKSKHAGISEIDKNKESVISEMDMSKHAVVSEIDKNKKIAISEMDMSKHVGISEMDKSKHAGISEIDKNKESALSDMAVSTHARISEINKNKESAISEMDMSKHAGISEIDEYKETAISDMDVSKHAGISEINMNKGSAISEIDKSKHAGISEIDKNKDGAIFEIDQNKESAISEIDKSKHAGISDIDKNKESAISEIDKSKHAGISDIDKNKESAISEIDKSKHAGISDIDKNKESAIFEIDKSKHAGISEINRNKESAFSDMDVSKRAVISEIDKNKESAISEMDMSKHAGISEIDKNKETAISDMDVSKHAGISEINMTKQSAISEIDKSKHAGISEIDKNKDGAIFEIDQNKESAISEIDKSKHAGISDIDKNKESAISEIDKSKHAGISEIDKNKESVISEIDKSKHAGISEIDKNKESAISDMAVIAHARISEIDKNKETAISDMDVSKHAGISEINMTKESAISEIDKSKHAGISEIDKNKVGAIFEIDQNKENVISEIDESKHAGISKIDQNKESAISEMDKRKHAGISEINKNKESAISDMDVSKHAVITEIDENKESAISEMNMSKHAVISEIDQNKESAISEIDKSQHAGNSEIDKSKDAGISEIDKNKESAISEIDKSKHAGISEIDQNKESAISEIDKGKHAIVSEIDKNKESVIFEIDKSKHAGISEINRNKESAISDMDVSKLAVISEIDQNKESAISEIDKSKHAGISEIDKNKESVIFEIDKSKHAGISEINRNKESAISDMDLSKLAVISEIDQNKESATSEIDMSKHAGIFEIDKNKKSVISEIVKSKHAGICEIDQNKESAISDVDKSKHAGISEMDKSKTAGISEIDKSKHAGISEIDKNKTGAISEIGKTKELGILEIGSSKDHAISEIDNKIHTGVVGIALVTEQLKLEARSDIRKLGQPSSKGMQQEPAMITDAVYRQLKSEFKEDLLTLNREKHSNISISPLLEETDTDILGFYVPPAFSCVELHKPTLRGPCSEVRRPIQGLKDVFYNKSKRCSNVFLTSEAGQGKTAFCKYLTLIWCNAHQKNKNRHNFSDTELHELQEFDFLFHISLRDVSAIDCDIDDMIGNQIVQYLSRTFKYNADFVQELLHRERHLVILDGLDEWTHPEPTATACRRKREYLPHRKAREKCTILTTTRSWKLSIANLKSSQIDNHIEIGSLDEESWKQMINNTVTKIRMHQNQNTADDISQNIEDISEEIRSRFIPDFEVNLPILTYLICLWIEGKPLGRSKCEMYSNILQMLLFRLKEKIPTIEINASDLQTYGNRKLPLCFETKGHIKSFYSSLLLLGQLAFEALFNKKMERSLVFDTSVAKDILTDKALDFCLATGLLVQSKVPGQLTTRDTRISFSHKTFQEFFAALYIQSQSNPSVVIQQVLAKCHNVEKILEMSNVLIFLSGMSPESASLISKKFFHVVNEDNVTISYRQSPGVHLMSVRKTFQNLQDMCIACIKEIHDNTYDTINLKVSDVIIDKESYNETYFCNLQTTILMNIKNIRSVRIEHRTSKVNTGDIITRFHLRDVQTLEMLLLYCPIITDDLECLLAASARTLKQVCVTGVQWNGTHYIHAYNVISDATINAVSKMRRLQSLVLECSILSHSQLELLTCYLTERTCMKVIFLRNIICSDHQSCKGFNMNLSQHSDLECVGLTRYPLSHLQINTSSLKKCMLGPLQNGIAVSPILRSLPEARNLTNIEIYELESVLDLVLDTIPQLVHLQIIGINNTNMTERKLKLSRDMVGIKFILLGCVTISCASFEQLVRDVKMFQQSIHVGLYNCTVTPTEEYERIKDDIKISDRFIVDEDKKVGYEWIGELNVFSFDSNILESAWRG